MHFNVNYLTSYRHACCGHFIQIILGSIVTNKPKQILTFPDDGTARNVMGANQFGSIFSRFKYNLLPNYIPPIHNFHEYCIPKNNCAFSWAEHSPPNWELMFSKFPRTKNILIKVSDDMILRVLANSHYKQLDNPVYIKKLQDSGIDVYNMGHQGVVQLTYETMVQADERIDDMFLYPFRSKHIVPKEYSDRVYEIELYDIIHNKEKVLDILERVTGIKPHENVYLSYENYLNKQRELIPWLDDVRK